MDLTPFIELGGTVVVAIFAMWVMLQLEKRKSPLNGSGKEMLKELQSLNTNHLHDICERMDRGNQQVVEGLREINQGQKQMIEILGEIKGKIK